MFRGSGEGFTFGKFYEICDNQSHTVSIIKVRDSYEILEGCNPIELNSDFSGNSYDIIKDIFIFISRYPMKFFFFNRILFGYPKIFNG